jgi:cytochrome c-type biogenesis protein CcsB
MEFFQAQTFLGNFSFSILFLLMLFYWIEASFFSTSQYHFLGFFGTVLVNLSLALLLLLRWIEEGHFPLSNLYESLIFLSWSFTFIHIILEKTTPNLFIGVITSPIALFTNAFGAFTLPSEMQKASSLVPALQSNWLMMHVTIMILSYASLIIGSLFAILFLVISFYGEDRQNKLPFLSVKNEDFKEDNINEKTVLNQKIVNQNFALPLRGQSTVALPLPIEDGEQVTPSKVSNLYLNNNSLSVIENRLLQFSKKTSTQGFWTVLWNVIPKFKNLQEGQATDYSLLSQNLDNLSYRILGIGFPLLTIGILSGAVWANEAWGSYWSWDPKETWALITWLTYAIYLHTRITNGWSGKKPAIIASIGFIIVWICYLGVNLLGKGLHSYGWVQSLQSLNNLF